MRHRRSSARPAAIAHSITDGESAPLASARRAVRGLRASISRSRNRFAAIAAVRAPSTASVIQPSAAGDGRPRAARIAPTYAKGSAKSVCSMRISRRKSASFHRYRSTVPRSSRAYASGPCPDHSSGCSARSSRSSPYSRQRSVTRSRIASVHDACPAANPRV